MFSEQCSHKRFMDLADLEQKWKNLCLPVEKFRAILQLDPCEEKIEWIKFLALGCSTLGGVCTCKPLLHDSSNYMPCLKRV
jgi:hypothetical protein